MFSYLAILYHDAVYYILVTAEIKLTHQSCFEDKIPSNFHAKVGEVQISVSKLSQEKDTVEARYVSQFTAHNSKTFFM